MTNRSISIAGLTLGLFAFLITYNWGDSDPDQLTFSEALTTAAAVYIMVFLVLKIFAAIIDRFRD
ncbi:MAG: hypothetical protein FJW76_03200 [Actinobacteria bacterium]|nr:hypothetical protein [Actinomycetota bacterium]